MKKISIFSKASILKILLFNVFLLIEGCGNSAETKLEECLKITGVGFEGTHRSGLVYGDANFEFEENGKSVFVEYSALSYSEKENAKLENLELKEDGPNNTYRIVGDYVVDGGWGQNAKFQFSNFEDKTPNTILVQVTGAGYTDDGKPSWVHFSNLTLTNDKFQEIKKILTFNKSDVSKVNEIKKEANNVYVFSDGTAVYSIEKKGLNAKINYTYSTYKSTEVADLINNKINVTIDGQRADYIYVIEGNNLGVYNPENDLYDYYEFDRKKSNCDLKSIFK